MPSDPAYDLSVRARLLAACTEKPQHIVDIARRAGLTDARGRAGRAAMQLRLMHEAGMVACSWERQRNGISAPLYSRATRKDYLQVGKAERA